MNKAAGIETILHAEMAMAYLNLLFAFVGCVAVIVGMVIVVRRGGVHQGKTDQSIKAIAQQITAVQESQDKKIKANCDAITRNLGNVEDLRKYVVHEFKTISDARYVTHDQHHRICSQNKVDMEHDVADLRTTAREEKTDRKEMFSMLAKIDTSVGVLASEFSNFKNDVVKRVDEVAHRVDRLERGLAHDRRAV